MEKDETSKKSCINSFKHLYSILTPMQPRIKYEDVQLMSGIKNVDEIHQILYQDYLSCVTALRNLPDWLKDQNPSDYQKREDFYKYHKYVLGELSAWLSALETDTITSEELCDKYIEFREEFSEQHPTISLDSL